MAQHRSARQPRQWAKEPDLFGEVPTDRMEWVTPADAFEQACLHAAKIQHEVVLVANGYRRLLGSTWKDLSPRFELSYLQLVKIVRGQAHMSMRHAAEFTRVLGPVLITEYRRKLLDRSPER